MKNKDIIYQTLDIIEKSLKKEITVEEISQVCDIMSGAHDCYANKNFWNLNRLFPLSVLLPHGLDACLGSAFSYPQR